MLSRDLTPSTDRPDFSFGGASRISFTEHLDPDRSINFSSLPNSHPGSATRFRFPLCDDPEGSSAFIEIRCLSGDGTPVLDEELAHRLLCHYLITQLPGDALVETANELADLYDFYKQRVNVTRVLPKAEAIPARLGEMTVRPVYPVSDEE